MSPSVPNAFHLTEEYLTSLCLLIQGRICDVVYLRLGTGCFLLYELTPDIPNSRLLSVLQCLPCEQSAFPSLLHLCSAVFCSPHVQSAVLQKVIELKI